MLSLLQAPNGLMLSTCCLCVQYEKIRGVTVMSPAVRDMQKTPVNDDICKYFVMSALLKTQFVQHSIILIAYAVFSTAV